MILRKKHREGSRFDPSKNLHVAGGIQEKVEIKIWLYVDYDETERLNLSEFLRVELLKKVASTCFHVILYGNIGVKFKSLKEAFFSTVMPYRGSLNSVALQGHQSLEPRIFGSME
ncbi:hypothetical protein TNCV_2719231 [Trichonephila clavipes]|nr:hypothetical protein TNCV_2719231 [Trichonephila clavipes]